MTAGISAALVAAQADLTNPVKNASANTGQFSYSYADLPTILDHVRPVLAKHDLAVTQNVAMTEGRLEVFTTVHHAGGEFLTFGPISGTSGGNWQALGSAITYARRYSLTAALGIAGEDDDDAQATQAAPVAKAKPQPKIERVSHSDQVIPEEDPWASNAPVAVATELLGAEPLYTTAERPRNHPEPASPAQIKFAKALATEWAAEYDNRDPLAHLNNWLAGHNYGTISDFEALGWRAAKPFIESAKTRNRGGSDAQF